MSEEIDKKRKTGWKQKMRRVGSQWRDKKRKRGRKERYGERLKVTREIVIDWFGEKVKK